MNNCIIDRQSDLTFIQFTTRDYGEMLLRTSTIDAIVKTVDGHFKVVSSVGEFYVDRAEKDSVIKLLLTMKTITVEYK